MIAADEHGLTIDDEHYPSDSPPARACVDRVMHALAGLGAPWWDRD